MDTTQILAAGHGKTFSDGTCRPEFHVLADGTLETGTGTCPRPYGADPTAWQAPSSWRALADAKAVAKFANSPMSEGAFWRSLTEEIRAAVRARYGMNAPGQTYPCRGARDGCGARVARQGAYCPRCAHDAD